MNSTFSRMSRFPCGEGEAQAITDALFTWRQVPFTLLRSG